MNENTKQRKVLQHKFFNRFSVIGAILFILLSMLIAEGLPLLIMPVILGLAGMEQDMMTIGGMFACAVAAFLVLALFWRFFYPEYEGGLKGKDIPKWIGVVLLVAAYTLIAAYISSKVNGTSFGMPKLSGFAMALMAGCCEEVAFRGTAASYLIRQWKTEKLFPVMMLTSVLFSLAHASGILGGAPVFVTICQLIFTFGNGMLMFALFVRSGSLWPSIISHVLNDIIAATNTTSLSETGAYASDMTLSTYEVIVDTLLPTAIFIVLALILVRPSVREEIAGIWNNKWKTDKGEE